jgi:RHS repeat-associated protein
MRTSSWLAEAQRILRRKSLGRTRRGEVSSFGTGGGRTRSHPSPRRAVMSIVLLSLFILALSCGLALAVGGARPGDPTNADAAEPSSASSQTPEGAGAGWKPPHDAVEIPAARTETSDTFRLPGGSREARIYAAPINYETPKGKWAPIGEELEPLAGGGLTNGANSFELSLPETLGAEPVRLSSEGEWVSSRLLGEHSEPAEVDGATASYEAAAPGTTFELSSTATGVDETIELETPSQPNSFHYELEASQGLTPELEKDGSVVFRSTHQTIAAVLPPPTVTDSAVGAEPDPEAVSYGLEPLSAGRWRLELTVDHEYLEATQRVWPVIVDPTIEIARESSGAACQLYVEETSGGGAEGSLCTGDFLSSASVFYSTKPGVVHRGRVALKFKIEPAITDDYIASAAVNVYGAASGPENLELRPITKTWALPTWKAYNQFSEKLWETPGGDFGPGGSELSTAEHGTAEGWFRFTKGLGPIVRQWNKEAFQAETEHKVATNNGLMLKIGEESSCESTCGEIFALPCGYSCGRGRSFTLNAANGYKPYLSINYYPRAPLSSKLISPTEGTRTARRLKLRSKWTVAGVESVTYQYREGKTGPFETIPAGLVSNTKGEAVSWPIPVNIKEHETKPIYFDAAHVTPTLRKKGGIIQVRALFEGPTEVAGYSAPVEAKVNRSLGAADDATASVGPGSVDLLTGNFSMTDADVSIPTFNSSLGFSRSFNSRGLAPKGSAEETEELKSPLGPGWKSGVPVEEAGGSEWRNLKIVEEKGSYEEEIGEEEIVVREYSFSYAIVTDLEGGELPFEKTPSGYVAPPEVPGWSLTTEEGKFVLSDPAGDRTTFSNLGEGAEYVPTAISQPGGSGVTTNRVEYELKEGKKRVHMVIAPSPPGITCTSQAEATIEHAGCRALILTYLPATHWGAPAADGERLSSITYYAPGNGGPWEVAKYEYNPEGRLTEEWDPRISPALKEKFTYETNGALRTITPAGEEPWTLEYGTVDEEEGIGRLFAVKRPSLITSPTTAQTTIDYEIPISGAGAPYEMGGASVGQWGQIDIPVDATAIFPADQVPTARPPSSYTHATVYYVDAQGHGVNTATPSGAGTASPSISTSETDEFGNVERELTPANRLRVLAEPECKHYAEEPTCSRRKKAETLDTEREFNPEGTQLEVEVGPQHQVRLESGTSVAARFHKVIQYDKLPAGVTLPSPDPHLPTRETTGASGSGELQDERVTETEYDWILRKPTKTITIMGTGKANIESSAVYDDTTGLVTQTRQPKNKAGGGAGTTKVTYYTAGSSGGCLKSAYAGLRCEVGPAAQPGTAGLPELLVTKYTGYDGLDQPTEMTESPGGGASNVRQTVATYDAAGRQKTRKIEGGGTSITKTGTIETTYSPTLGAAAKMQFVCTVECTGFDSQASTNTYNALGQVTEYVDADGNKTKLTYDVDGRPLTVTDNKGSQTISYDPTSGLESTLVDSAAGSFTASYDADGNLVEQTLPNGITAKTTYNEVDEPIKLAYTKTSSCGTGGCTWLEESVERSIYGQIINSTGTLGTDHYKYDRDGRLEEGQETPKEGNCITRVYAYDEDSNRTAQTTREPGTSMCAGSGGTKREYNYDSADRLLGEGLVYDAWGRITSLPANDAGGHALTTGFYSTNMVAKQEQNGITNTYELDALGRQRARLQGGGGLEGTEVFHYDGPGDTPSWTERGATWSRDIAGISGELAAIQESSGTTTFQLTDLRGDVVASASSSPTAEKLLAKYRFTEFGEPTSGAPAGRFGWLGGKARKTELPSGVVQMGARSYIPQLGRFLSPDPVPGGSANTYDYADQDPVNKFDLAGTCSKKKKCLGGMASKQEKSPPKTHAAIAAARPVRVTRLSVGGVLNAVGNIASKIDPTAGTVAVTAANVILNHNPAVIGVQRLQAAVRSATSYVIEGLAPPIQHAAEACDNAFVATVVEQTTEDAKPLNERTVRKGAYACVGAWLGSF